MEVEESAFFFSSQLGLGLAPKFASQRLESCFPPDSQAACSPILSFNNFADFRRGEYSAKIIQPLLESALIYAELENDAEIRLV